LVFVLPALGVLPASAHAQGVGLQGGFTIDPEQIFVGSHLETGEIAPDFRFRPGIDGAFGGDVTLASINVDFVYAYDLGGVWSIYQGGGPVILLYRVGEPAETDVTGGFSGLFGLAHDNGFFFEFKIGSNRGPILKFGIGVTVR
jgi:hypothetical protein